MKITDMAQNNNSKEIMHNGTHSFPFAIDKIIPNENILGCVDWHWHDEVQFCIVKKKSIQIHIAGQELTLKSGDGIFINKGCIHKITSLENDSLYFAFMINPQLIYGFKGSLLETKYTYPIFSNENLLYCILSHNIDWQNDILTLLNSIQDLHTQKNPGYEFDITIEILKIWKSLFFNVSKEDIKPYDMSAHTSDRLKSIYSFIHEHYQDKITLDDIALNLHISKNECCRFFKKYTGTTLFEYLTTFRITKSLELLQNSNLNITEIALSVGFTSSSYYINKFNKYTGFTPLKYRLSFQSANSSIGNR